MANNQLAAAAYAYAYVGGITSAVLQAGSMEQVCYYVQINSNLRLIYGKQ